VDNARYRHAYAIALQSMGPRSEAIEHLSELNVRYANLRKSSALPFSR
jgi:hypothetical protein